MNLISKNHNAVITKALILSLSTVSAILAGCGGVVGEQTSTGSNDLNQSGTPYANAKLSLDPATIKTDTSSIHYGAASKSVEFGARAHLSDVGNLSGLTGEGVWIEIIDDFTTPHDSRITFPSIQRSKTTTANTNSAATTEACNLSYVWNTTFTHGDLVSSIAGGITSFPSLRVNLSLPTNVSNPACVSTFYPDTNAPLTAILDVEPIPGTAPKAITLRGPVDLSAAQDPLQTFADIQGHLQNGTDSKTIGVINLSLGRDINGVGKTFDEVMAAVEKFPITSTVNTVITVAAGNNSKPCNKANLNGCNDIAVALASQAATQKSTIVVGALTGSGQTQIMASYSTQAGFLKDRFIWAPGDSGFYPDANGNLAQGTSFAAPRVAGVAALLKQKYPQLNSEQIADIILQSASKDMNNDGKDDFSGVDPIFGNGKLNLTNALTLAAKLYP